MDHGDYLEPGPTRDEIDATRGVVALDFGENWCGFCEAARGLIEAVLNAQPSVRHIKLADGPGRPLGRSFRIKLWPTLVFLKDGREIGRVVRPGSLEAIQTVLDEAVGEGGTSS